MPPAKATRPIPAGGRTETEIQVPTPRVGNLELLAVMRLLLKGVFSRLGLSELQGEGLVEDVVKYAHTLPSPADDSQIADHIRKTGYALADYAKRPDADNA